MDRESIILQQSEWYIMEKLWEKHPGTIVQLYHVLKEITVYEERSESSQAITMKPQEVRNVASDQKEWILLEAKDGTKGWIRVERFSYFPTENADHFELFDGLNMAD